MNRHQEAGDIIALVEEGGLAGVDPLGTCAGPHRTVERISSVLPRVQARLTGGRRGVARVRQVVIHGGHLRCRRH